MVIKSFLPNPIGRDQDGERIVFQNDGAVAVDLNGWKVRDAAGKEYVIKNVSLNAGEELVLDYKTTRITLNNDGETIALYDAAGNKVDELSYVGKAKEGQVITRNEKVETLLRPVSGGDFGGQVRNEIVEDLTQVGDIIPAPRLGGDAVLTLVVAAAALAIAALYVIKRFE